MQFASFEDLQSLRQDMITDGDMPFFQPLLQTHQAPGQFHSILQQIQDINHARSLSTSMLQGNVDMQAEFDLNDQKQSQQFIQHEQIVFTPTKIMINESRKSTIFTATLSGQSNSQRIMLSSNKTPKQSIKIYYFNKPVYKFISYTKNTTIVQLINRAISAYSLDLSLDQNLIGVKDPRYYQMRFLKEEDKCEADFSVDAIKKDRIISESLFQILVLVKIPKDRKLSNIAGFKDVQKEVQQIEDANVKLHILNQANMLVTTITLQKTETLEKAINFLQAELNQPIILTQSFQSDMILPGDIEIQNLGTFKLYVKKKKYLDQPQTQKTPLRIRSVTLPKDLTQSVLPPIGITEASRYQQFQVIKINKRGVEQPRIIGFDQTKYYNYDPLIRKKNDQASFFSVFMGNNIITGTKKPQRLISQIVALNSLNQLNFQIVFPDKKIQFRCDTHLKKQKIIRKLNFLIQYNKNRLT